MAFTARVNAIQGALRRYGILLSGLHEYLGGLNVEFNVGTSHRCFHRHRGDLSFTGSRILGVYRSGSERCYKDRC